MIGRIVEITERGRHVAKSRGFLTVSSDGVEIGRVPMDDLAAVVTVSDGVTISSNLIAALADRCVPLIVCDSYYRPAAFLWTSDGHHEQAGRMADQASASKPLQKRLWAQIVKTKIKGQGATLRAVGMPHEHFFSLARQVRSGDPNNLEAQAARRYWPLLFGKEFRRERKGGGINALLNYSYTVLRAGTARAVMAAGLHPSIGIAHRQRGNSFALADDLMEPFRPIADLLVHRLISTGLNEVGREAKLRLARILLMDMETSVGTSPVGQCLHRLASSTARCFEGRSAKLEIPEPVGPLFHG